MRYNCDKFFPGIIAWDIFDTIPSFWFALLEFNLPLKKREQLQRQKEIFLPLCNDFLCRSCAMGTEHKLNPLAVSRTQQHTRIVSSINSSNWENYTVGKIEGNDGGPLFVERGTKNLHISIDRILIFTTKHNEIDTVVALDFALLTHVLLCENAHFYNLFIAACRLFQRTIKYIKIIVSRCTMPDVLLGVGFTLVKNKVFITFYLFLLIRVFAFRKREMQCDLRRKLQQIMDERDGCSTGGPV